MATTADRIDQIYRAPAGGARNAADTPKRPLPIRIGKKLRRSSDRLIAASSMVGNAPILSPSTFPWMETIRANWTAIRDEALCVTRRIETVPTLRSISPDHCRIAADDKWRSFFLIGYGARIEENIQRCPATMAILKAVPGLNSGFFSILAPGTHIPRHRGVTKGLITCHLGLQVPEGRGLRMTVDDREVGWADGELLVFDDTYHHEVWNDTDETRIVLLLQFERPLRQPGRAWSKLMLAAIRQSAFVRDAVKNIAAMKTIAK